MSVRLCDHLWSGRCLSDQTAHSEKDSVHLFEESTTSSPLYSAHIVALTINIISIFKQNPKPSPAEGHQACCQAGSPRRPTERSRPFWIRVKSWITQHGMMYLFTMCNHQLLCFTVYIAEPAFDESNVFPTTVMFDLGWNLHPQTMCAAL